MGFQIDPEAKRKLIELNKIIRNFKILPMCAFPKTLTLLILINDN